ncbi:MAG: hypothetical protein ABW360_03980 [Phenylobacterium sp.]
MSLPNGNQVVFLSAQVSAALLENAASPAHDEALNRALRQWLPDRSEVDDHALKAIAATVRENLLVHRALLLQRCDRLVEQGKAEPL